MRWKGRRQSDNVEDRRGASPGGLVLGGAGTLIVVVVAMFLGADPRALLEQLQATSPETTQGPAVPNPEQDELATFVSVVLAETETVWHEQFRQAGATYEEPRLVLFSGQVQSACGMAGAAMGPFYCPGDRQVYIDLDFYRTMRDRIGAPGDMAQAYVIAHEVGHHVQNLLGISDQVHAQRGRLSETEFNRLSVRLELQADYFAGVWAHHARRAQDLLEAGDLEEAMNAASAIGDDRLQRQSQGTVVPDAFTHGTSEQRLRWFRRGLESGDFRQGDTFGAATL